MKSARPFAGPRRRLRRPPPDPEILAILKRANGLLARRRYGVAAVLLARGVVRFPKDAAIGTRRAYALHLGGRIDAAAAEYARALALDGRRFDAWFGLGCAEFARGAYAKAMQSFAGALARRPDHPQARFEMARALFQTGRVDAAIDDFRLAAEDEALHVEALGRIARLIPGAPRADNAAILQARRDWADREAGRGVPPQRPARRRTGGRLRIGYVSAFFAARNWMKPVWGVINHHDRALFNIHLFVDGGLPDPGSGYVAGSGDMIHDITGLANEDVAARIAALGIDVLVDLNGYSFPERFGVFIRRPACVIVGWFNMYATTGIAAFDFIVGDDVVVPRGDERFYSERVVRVPGSYLAFSVLYPVPEVVPPPCLAGATVTFGAFCPLYKITDTMTAAWAAILRGAPAARLLIRNAALGERSNRLDLRDRLSRSGVPVDRVRLAGPAEHREFLAAYGDVDIALDSFPYNGGTTTMEALWQGVPVLAFVGDRWAARISASLLLAAGLSDWCMPGLPSYVERAIALAESPSTPTLLASLRTTMRDRLTASPICDTARLCRRLERLYGRAAAATVDIRT